MALDTTPILGKGAVQDTYNLLGEGIEQLARRFNAMIERLLIAACLVGMTVTIHAAGLALVLERVWRSPARLL